MKSDGSIEYRVGEPMPGTKWVVRGKLGQGGMGLVLDVRKAEWIQGAMKVLLPPFAKVPEFAARFLDEVKVTATLQHANIVQVLDFDRLADGTPFMVMERLRGRTLRAALRDTRQRGKAWTPANTYAVAAQVCEGLYRAHSHVPSIVHRDVKPENVYLHRADERSLESIVKVMDFGVAAVVGERDQRAVGTPRYMAPEQVSGDRVTPQTDQYALAIVIYEMLTGRFPWDVDICDASALAEVHLRAAPAPPSRFSTWVPERVDAAILKALSKDPSARHEGVHGLMFELVGLQWANDRSSTGSTDVNSTDPMVGTLADGIPSVREDHDTHEGISSLLVEGGSLEVPGDGVTSDISVEFAEDSSRVPLATRAVSRYGLEPALGAARPGNSKRAAEAAVSHPLPTDTPMTGESGRGPSGSSVSGELLARLGRAGALGLFLSAVVAALLVTAGVVRSSRAPNAKPSIPSESRLADEHGVKQDPEGPHREPMTEPSAAPPAPTALEPIPSFRPASASTDGGTGKPQGEGIVSVTRRTTPVRAPVRAPVAAKGRIPDDGRDELYVPGTR
jgi:serine/threonine protein kinase